MQVLAGKAGVIHVATDGDPSLLRGIEDKILHVAGNVQDRGIWVIELRRDNSVVTLRKITRIDPTSTGAVGHDQLRHHVRGIGLGDEAASGGSRETQSLIS